MCPAASSILRNINLIKGGEIFQTQNASRCRLWSLKNEVRQFWSETRPNFISGAETIWTIRDKWVSGLMLVQTICKQFEKWHSKYVFCSVQFSLTCSVIYLSMSLTTVYNELRQSWILDIIPDNTSSSRKIFVTWTGR